MANALLSADVAQLLNRFDEDLVVITRDQSAVKAILNQLLLGAIALAWGRHRALH